MKNNFLKKILTKIFGTHSPSEECMLKYPSIEEWHKSIAIPSGKISNDKWIWVEGYKGTDSNMCCRGYQFELGKQFDMPKDEDVDLCRKGFHFCEELKNTYHYYGIGDNNRFFKVKALVKESDWLRQHTGLYPDVKFVARSIEFVSEIEPDEILIAWGVEDIEDWTNNEKQEALCVTPYEIVKRHQLAKLIDQGYSTTFANFLTTDKDLCKRAIAVGSQEGVSMDMKVFAIFSNRIDD